MTTATAPARPVGVLGAIGASWLLTLGLAANGAASLHHDALVEGGLPVWVSLPLFLLAWQLMLTAMMLPSSLPLIRLFTTVSRRHARPAPLLAAFLCGYALVWSSFGAVAFVGDIGIHQLVHGSGWLSAHESVIAGGTLAVAGAFQFTPLKKRCLAQCRQPASFLVANYAQGLAGAFRLGRRHGVFCLGCCFALMLLMFAAGVANLAWMTALTLLMVYEKSGRGGTRVVPVAGTVLLLWAAAVVAGESWLPPFLNGAL